MSFVVVDTASRCAVRHPRSGRETYSTEAAARAARTRFVQEDMEAYLSGRKYPRTDYEVMTTEVYRAQVPMREVRNLVTGAVVMEPADLPWHCSVGSESYWSS